MSASKFDLIVVAGFNSYELYYNKVIQYFINLLNEMPRKNKTVQ